MQYGDQTWTTEATGDFIGEGAKHHHKKHALPTVEEVARPASSVNSRDIPVHLAYYKYVRSTQFSAESKAALAALRAELDAREVAEERFTKIASLLSVDSKGTEIHAPELLFASPATPIISGLCVKDAVKELQAQGCDYDDYSLQFHKVIVNACAHQRHTTERAARNAVVHAIRSVCSAN